MSGEGLLIILLVGVIAGWLAGQIVRGTGFGIIGDLVVGIIGAFIGDWLLPRVGIHLGVGIVAAIANATIGAIVLLLVVRLVRGGGTWQGNGWGGGLVPIITTSVYLSTNSIGWALAYPIGLPAIMFVIALFVMPETRMHSIWEEGAIEATRA